MVVASLKNRRRGGELNKDGFDKAFADVVLCPQGISNHNECGF